MFWPSLVEFSDRASKERRAVTSNAANHGVHYEETDISYRTRADPGRRSSFRVRLPLRQSRYLRFTGTERIGLAHQSPQSDACACPLAIEPLPRRLAPSPRSRPNLSSGEPGQLALSARLRHVAFAPRNRQLALRTASDRNAITCPLRRLLSLGLIANNESLCC